MPLIGGIVAALLAVSGRLAGRENALKTLWHVPLAAWPGVPGAAILLLVHRHQRLVIRPLALLLVRGRHKRLVLRPRLAEVTGLADATTTAGMTG